MNYNELTPGELKDLLTKRGIEFAPRAQKKSLISLLEAYDEATSSKNLEEKIAEINEGSTEAHTGSIGAPEEKVATVSTTTTTVESKTTSVHKDTVVEDVTNTKKVTTTRSFTNSGEFDAYMAHMNAIERADKA